MNEKSDPKRDVNPDEIPTRELQKWRRRQDYEREKARRRAARRAEKEKRESAKAEQLAQSDKELWAGLVKASSLSPKPSRSDEQSSPDEVKN